MHVAGDSIAKDFLENSVHFQTDTVLTLYTVIFTALTVLCIVQYQLAKMKPKTTAAKAVQASEQSQERT